MQCGLSKLHYANAFFLGSKNKDVARLQRLQNRAARIVFQVPRRHSTSLLLNTLHWLPLDKRIKLKTLLYIFKALNDLSPVYLKDCIATHVPSREGLRSSRDVTRLSIPKSSRRIGDGSFSVFGATLWNTLPNTIRSSPTISAFKRNLKTYLF